MYLRDLQQIITYIKVRAYADAVIKLRGGAARSGSMAAASVGQKVNMMLPACTGHQ